MIYLQIVVQFHLPIVIEINFIEQSVDLVFRQFNAKYLNINNVAIHTHMTKRKKY